MKTGWGEYFRKNPNLSNIFLLIAVLVIANPIYFLRYWFPPAMMWDESYHIASAAKYLTHTFFMEPHPPLGKLLIALGEWITNPNKGSVYWFNQVPFINSDVLPDGMTFAGYRLMPTLFAWGNAALMSLVFLQLTSSRFWAFILTITLYVFDNALVAHSRQAGLDPFLITGFLLSMLGFLRLLSSSKFTFGDSFLMIFGFSFAVMTKAFGLAILVLWPLLYVFVGRKGQRAAFGRMFGLQSLFFILFASLIWQIHFTLGKNLQPQLLNNGTYFASSEYEKILMNLPGAASGPEAFYIKLRDNLRFFKAYEDRVKPLNLDEGDATGSFPISWPFGSRPISYRWTTRQESPVRYLFMVPNIFVWVLCLLALLVSIGAFLNEKIFSVRIMSSRLKQQLGIFLVLYFSFMLPMSIIRRTLYLNHYFLPLILTMMMGAVILRDLIEKPGYSVLKRYLIAAPFISALLFFYMSPLTYYEPLTCAQANSRNFFRFWSMKFAYCADPAFGTVWKNTEKSDRRDNLKLRDL